MQGGNLRRPLGYSALVEPAPFVGNKRGPHLDDQTAGLGNDGLGGNSCGGHKARPTEIKQAPRMSRRIGYFKPRSLGGVARDGSKRGSSSRTMPAAMSACCCSL